MTVEGPDGQYYVVLDVTQLEVQAQDDVRSVQVVQDNQVQQVLIQETQILSDSGDGVSHFLLSRYKQKNVNQK